MKFTNVNWDIYWNGRMDCRQSKLWFPSPNPKIPKEILKFNKTDYGMLICWFTGHCFLARHEALIHNVDPTCNLCFLDDQTPWQLLKECPATNTIRTNIPPENWTAGIILKAIKTYHIWTFFQNYP